MLNIELINLYSIISAIISSTISSASILSKIITLKTFIKHKNLMLETPGLAINSHIATDNTQTI